MVFRFEVQESPRAHLPEAEAYRRFLRGLQFDGLERNVTILVRFMGFEFFQSKLRRGADIVIADYPSASTGNFRRSKDWVKRQFNARADLTVACGEYVLHHSTPHVAPYVTREMGYFAENVHPQTNPDYDVIYAGSLNRPGTRDAIERLSRLGLKVAVASGDTLSNLPAVTHHGNLNIADLYELYSRCRLGLNVVPNSLPFALQASTKVIEYCAAGLGVITSQSPWIRQFQTNRGGYFMDLEAATSIKAIMSFPYRPAAVADLNWQTIFERSRLRSAIEERLDAISE